MKKKSQYGFRHLLAKRWSATRKWLASDQLRRVRTALFQGYILIALLAFSGLALTAAMFPTLNFDVLLTRDLQRIMPAWFGPVLGGVSWFGFGYQSVVIIAITTIVLYSSGLRWEGITALFASASTGAINYLVKIVVARPRPSADLVHVVEELNSFSFPSGHVMFYTAFFGFLLFLTYTLLKRSWLRFFLALFLLGLVLLVGPSRMWLGEHWGSDVLGGYLLGSLSLIMTLRFYRWGKLNYFVRQPIAVTGQTETNVPKEERKEIREAMKNPALPKQELENIEKQVPEAKQKADTRDSTKEKGEKDAKNRAEDSADHT